jgi:hypothetical protein
MKKENHVRWWWWWCCLPLIPTFSGRGREAVREAEVRERGGGRQGEGERGRGTERQKQWVCEFKAGMVYIPFSF